MKATLRRHVHLATRQFLYLPAEVNEGEPRLPWNVIDEEVQVTVRPRLIAGKGAEDPDVAHAIALAERAHLGSETLRYHSAPQAGADIKVSPARF